MCRGGPRGPLRRARPIGSLPARLLAVIAALMLAVGGANAGHAHPDPAEPGIEMVICSDGGVKTVVLDRQGNPIETSDDEACLGFCPCCTVPNGDVLLADTHVSAKWQPVARAEVFGIKPAHLPSKSGRRPNLRGPPSKEDA